MPTPASSAASSPIAAAIPSRTGASNAPARFGAAPTGAFASLLGQLGQPLTTPTAATPAAPGSDGTAATPSATLDQPSPPVSPAALLTTLPPAAPVPAAGIVSALNAQLSKANAGPKTADSKTAPDAASDADSPSPTVLADATTPAPMPETPPTPAIIATLLSVPSPATPTTIPANTVSSASDDPVTPSLISAASSTSTKGSTTPVASPPAPAPTSSRMADQAAAATQAGLSVGDDHQEDPVSPGPLNGPHQPSSATTQAGQNPPAPPLPSAAPQLVSPAAATPVAPNRTFASPPSRPGETDASSPSTSASNAVNNVVQPSSSSATDIQPPPPIPLPTSIPIAAGPTASTRSTQPSSPAPSPTTQVAQAIAEPVKVVLASPAQAGPTTPHVTTIQITPAELGRVDVRIERINDGPAKIQLVVERPETLSRLVHDQSQLQQALDHAGIPQNSRTIEFSLAPTTPDASAFSSNLSGNNASGGESSSSGFQRQNNAYYNQPFDESNPNKSVSPQSRTVRTGIDITA